MDALLLFWLSSLSHDRKVSLGMFGVVTEVTIQCVPRHKLLERTAVLSREEVRSRHSRLLKRYKHLRYMWIPYVDAVVVVACNPVHVREEVSQEEKYQSTDPYAHDPDLESGKFNIGIVLLYPSFLYIITLAVVFVWLES